MALRRHRNDSAVGLADLLAASRSDLILECGEPVFGDCVAGHELDREIDTMMPSVGPLRQKLFRYSRYNAELTPEGLTAVGCGDIDPKMVQRLDSVDAIPSLARVGKAVAQHRIEPAHFNFGTFKT